jgi:hypothetical protein
MSLEEILQIISESAKLKFALALLLIYWIVPSATNLLVGVIYPAFTGLVAI